MRKLFVRIRAVVGSVVLIVPVISMILTQTAYAAAPTFTYSDVVGQSNDVNSVQQNWQGVSGGGFNYPFALKIDTVLHHLFVVDKGNNRVLVFNLDNSNELVDKTADYVIGQVNMSAHDANQALTDPTSATLSNPQDLTIDQTTHLLYVSDTNNSRVLVYDTTTLSTGMSATHVLGKNVMTVGAAPSETAPGGLASPYGIAVDSVHHRLFVANDPSRVSVFDISEGITDGMDAVAFLGQNSGTSTWNGCSGDIDANTLCNVAGGIAYNVTDNKLYVSDSQNHRVLEFDATVIASEQNAAHVLGQNTTVSQSFNGSTSVNTLVDPRAIAVDEATETLYISDAGYNSSNRISIFSIDGGDFGNDQEAANELGQPDFTSYNLNQHSGPNWEGYAAANTTALPYGVAFNTTTGKLFVADSENNRVLVYKSGAHQNNEDAIDFLGQPSFVSWGENAQSPTGNGFAFNAVTALDTVHHRLFEADYQNERVLEFDLNGANQLVDKTADHVLGAPSVFSLNWDKCDHPDINTLCNGEGIWGGLAYDAVNDHLFVTGGLNNRVLIYDTATITDGEDAIGLLGQPDYYSNSGCDWDEGVSSRTLCNPANLALDTIHHKLFVVDTANSRVMAYDLTEDTNLPVTDSASSVIGQGALYYPNGISLDTTNNRLYVADSGNNRIVSFDLSTRDGDGVITGMIDSQGMNGVAVDMVLGQDAVDSGDGCNRNLGATTAATLCYPEGVSVDAAHHRLYVADTNNNRVLGYQLSSTSAYLNTFANGQDADLVIGQPDMVSNSPNRGQSGSPFNALNYPWGVTIEPTTGTLYIADTSNNRMTIYQSQQDDIVMGLTSAEDGTPIALAQTGCTTYASRSASKESSLTVQDPAYSYPVGFASFTLTGCSGAANVVLTFTGNFSPTTTVIRKYNSSTHTFTTLSPANSGLVLTATTLENKPALQVAYTITDNGPLDQDPTTGTITDPVGIAANVVAAPNTGLGGRL